MNGTKKKNPKKYDDLFGLNYPEEQTPKSRPPKKTPHPMTDKYLNKHKDGNYRIVIYKHDKSPKLPIPVIVLICLATFALSFVLASIFL